MEELNNMEEHSEFVKSLKRLYGYKLIDETKVIELFTNGKINNDEKWFIVKQE